MQETNAKLLRYFERSPTLNDRTYHAIAEHIAGFNPVTAGILENHFHADPDAMRCFMAHFENSYANPENSLGTSFARAYFATTGMTTVSSHALPKKHGTGRRAMPRRRDALNLALVK